MQAFLSDNSDLNQWKREKQKEVLNKCIIQAGFCPSHHLIGKLTIIKERQQALLKEEFYLGSNSGSQKLLFRSFLRIENEAVLLVMERCGCSNIVLRRSVQETGAEVEAVSY